MTDQEYEEYISNLDEQSLRNLKKFSRFMARMIDKYGKKVLAELEEEKNKSEGDNS